MPEIPSGTIQEKHKSVEAQEYQRAKTRIEASKQMAQELQRGGNKLTATMNEVDGMVRGASRDNPDADATGYDRQRIRMVYHSPNDAESVSEDLVFFLKPNEEGNPEMLEVVGKPLFLNSDLYDANYDNAHYTRRLSDNHRLVPTVNHEGKMISVISLTEKGEPFELPQQ